MRLFHATGSCPVSPLILAIESNIAVRYFAELKPDSLWTSAARTVERVMLQSWIATELRKIFSQWPDHLEHGSQVQGIPRQKRSERVVYVERLPTFYPLKVTP
jgi:glutathione S-transferase